MNVRDADRTWRLASHSLSLAGVGCHRLPRSVPPMSVWARRSGLRS